MVPTDTVRIHLADGKQLYWLFFGLKGRISPGVYFLAGLLLFVAKMFLFYRLALAPPGVLESGSWTFPLLVTALLLGWCNFAITAKRFHDFGKPTIFAVIAFFIDFILVIVFSFVKGDAGPNKYGERTNAPG
jgi:uncharacterized membrane protein YhaH (DUF805 family)